MTSLRQLAERLQAEHDLLERSAPSPYITEMERFYVDKPAGYREKIDRAKWIPEGTREHMKEHVRLALLLKRKQTRVGRRVGFRILVSNPMAKTLTTKRYAYGKRKDGSVYKRSRSTGRFVALSRSEREEVRTHGK